jgi:uncharacterized protein with NAD-binding domain and iron-sulfur cluster
VTAAFELSATPELRDRFEVTLYTLGWRLGGKGASGRNHAKGDRIEEHGLHVWFGFYDNSFNLMRRAYEELDRPPTVPIRTWREGFEPCDNIILWDECHNQWFPRIIKPPRNSLEPGTDATLTFWEMAWRSLGWIREQCEAIVDEHLEMAEAAGLLAPTDLAPHAVEVLRDIGAEKIDVRGESVRDLLGLSFALAETRALNPELDAPDLSHERLLARMLHVLQPPWTALGNMLAPIDCEARFWYMALNFLSAVGKGIVQDVLTHWSFDWIDGEELKAWLHHHGTSDLTLDHAPWLRGYYDLAFAFEDGDPSKPRLAAGTALKDLLRIALNYKGALMWKMQAGMGDVVFAPLYEALRARKVSVRFFQRVRELKLSADGATVDRIRIQPQAELLADPYEPLVEVKRLPCWPTEPNWDQLVDGAALRTKLDQLGMTLEWEEYDSGLDDEWLERSKQHFDHVVLAMSVDSVRETCGELEADTANPNFNLMLDHSFSVMTQAFQLWFTKSIGDLGWRPAWGKDPISTAHVEPLDTYSDMSHLICCESWTGKHGEPTASIAYFCGPLPDAKGKGKAAVAAAETYAAAHLQSHLEHFWPNAYAGGAFDFDLLCGDAADHGLVRLKAQYCRANHSGSERYVTTFPDTVRYRLRPDQSGYDNLFLAGDWTRTGVDGGCVEAAVISGMLAAAAITGQPPPIIFNAYPFGG